MRNIYYLLYIITCVILASLKVMVACLRGKCSIENFKSSAGRFLVFFFDDSVLGNKRHFSNLC